MQAKLGPWCVVVLMVLAGCGAGGAGDGAPSDPDGAAAGAEAEEEEDYEVLLGAPLADTLRGDARFGFVADVDSGRNLLVIELVTGYDFAGGFFIAYGDVAPPPTGTHELVPVSDSLKGVPPGRYAILYRQGMLTDLTSQQGTVTFSTVSDTLVEGTFDAMLHGFLTHEQQRLPDATLRARGHFRARPGNTGFIIGL